MTTPPTQESLEIPDNIRLADFIRQNVESIVVEWIAFAKTRTPASDGMTHLALRNHIQEILTFIADDIETPQTGAEQFDKSRGLGPSKNLFADSAAETHAELRLADGFDIEQMISEYRALRASVIKQWTRNVGIIAARDMEDLTRFNEAIDQAMSESVTYYTNSISHSRNLFLGVLGHDLRNPIGAASMAAQIVAQIGGTTDKQTVLITQILNATERATHILDDLLDMARSSLGIKIPVAVAPMDMAKLAREIVDETITISGTRKIDLVVEGQAEGLWDKARMGQVLSNLLSNAIQYSPADSMVSVNIAVDGNQITLTVHNTGKPIAEDKVKNIFKSLTRGLDGDEEHKGTVNLGLGLYIAQKIVEAHQGTLDVVSSHEAGTTFTVRLPKA